MSALIVVDLQNDLCGNGTIGIFDIGKIIPIINRIKPYFKKIIFCGQSHPPNHTSFIDYGGKKSPHCIKNSKGIEFNDNLDITIHDMISYRGTLTCYDSDSIFYNSQSTNQMTKLKDYLTSENIHDIYFCGLTLDHTIFISAIDANRFHFKSHIIEDICLIKNRDSMNDIKNFMMKNDISFVNSSDITNMQAYIPTDNISSLYSFV